jgi:hypothetical protein
MRRVLLIACVVLFIAGATFSAFASGGKHRGKKGQGSVIQHQIRNIP